MQIDLGGIGKGFAADEAAAVLKTLGYHDALVALGGDIVAAGAPRERGAGPSTSRPLESSKPGVRILLRDAAVSTSGDAEQWVEIAGIRYSHIIDPRTGAALTGRRSVTVIAPRGALSDGLATGVSVLGSVEGHSCRFTNSRCGREDLCCERQRDPDRHFAEMAQVRRRVAGDRQRESALTRRSHRPSRLLIAHQKFSSNTHSSSIERSRLPPPA
jgi:hypothetical protein